MMRHHNRQAGRSVMADPESINLSPVLKRRLKRFNKRLAPLQDGADPDNVHEFRIVCRELLACRPLLQVLAPTGFWHKRVRRSLKVLNRLRDVQQMQSHLGDDTRLAPALAKRARQATRRWERYQPAVNTAVFRRSLKMTARTLKNVQSAQEIRLWSAWYTQWHRALGQVRKRLARVDAAHLRTVHRLRVSYKRLRYLLELLLEAGAPLAVDKAVLKQWQETLGTIEDYRVMAALARIMGGSPEYAAIFAQHADQLANAFVDQQTAFVDFIGSLEQAVCGLPTTG